MAGAEEGRSLCGEVWNIVTFEWEKWDLAVESGIPDQQRYGYDGGVYPG